MGQFEIVGSGDCNWQGDSAGGNLAAAVTLHLTTHPEGTAPCFQLLIYPALQAFDLTLPSYSTPYPFFLPSSLMARFWTNYLGIPSDQAEAFLQNNHTSPTLKISRYARYVDRRQLPEKYHSDTIASQDRDLNFGNVTLSDKIEHSLLNPFFAPLMERDVEMTSPALVVTAEHDVLRDDGLLYVERLAKAGVDVVNVHASDGFHGFLSFPHSFNIAHKTIAQIVDYAKNKFESCA